MRRTEPRHSMLGIRSALSSRPDAPVAALHPPLLGGHILKTRIVSSLALAAAIAVGATGCAMFAPQGTTDSYAPSDGIEASFSDLDVRNLLLVAAEDGKHFNVVFTAVNSGDARKLRISFTSKDGASEAVAEFVVHPGTEAFGDPEGENEPVFVAIPGLAPGDTVTAYLQISGAEDLERQIPVLDGTLAEYRPYVLPRSVTEGPSLDQQAKTGDDETAAQASEGAGTAE